MHRGRGLALAAILLLVSHLSAKRNDDVVVMENGDRMTGEIKKLEQGYLYFKADYMLDPVKLDWRRVERLQSKDSFNVSLSSGLIHRGLIEKKKDDQNRPADFFVEEETSTVQVPRSQVVVITPVEDTAWKQLTGAIDYGFNYTGGSPATTQSSLSGDINYRSEKWAISANGSSVFNAQSGAANTGRNTFSAHYTRFLTQNWYAGVLTQLLNSQQQELTLRTTTGGGLGRILMRSDRISLGFLAGASFSREYYAQGLEANSRVNNAESLFQLRYQYFRFKTTQINAELYAYPNVTTPGRVRSGGQSYIRIELFHNFYWKFSVYENFDTHPPVHAPRNDFGTGISFGWTY